MSSKVYDSCQEYVGPIEPTSVKLSGAGGNDIGLRGVARDAFWLRNTCYEHDMLIGGLAGMDMLLGFDWLCKVDAIIDLQQQVIRMGPCQRFPYKRHADHRHLLPTRGLW